MLPLDAIRGDSYSPRPLMTSPGAANPVSTASESGAYTDVYRGIHPVTPRSIARHAYLSAAALAAAVGGQTARAMRRPRVQFLFLHHVFRDQEDGFRAILRSLARDFTFIGYSDAVDRVLSGQIDRPYATVSFDDGYESCVRAAEIMAEFNAKACYFVCPKAPTLDSFEEVRTFCRERLHFPPTQFMSWEQIERLAAAGHEIGGHTVSHPPNMAALSEHQLCDEIGLCADELRARFGLPGHFAWPRGTFDVFPPTARRIVFDTGFRSCASALRGCHVAPVVGGDARLLCIRRDHVLANWPISHMRYFLAQNSRTATAKTNEWQAQYRADSVAADGRRMNTDKPG
jgi:peptidoglycan/xylan/chitin deacetylase (PgdA/CDA1 family)